MVFGVAWVEWFGYAASVVVAVSLMMSSIIRLRWLNLSGAAMFSAYGFIIGAMPVGFLNLFIMGVNVFYLRRLYREQDDFRIMKLTGDSEYLQYFLDSHRDEIAEYFPQFGFTAQAGRQVFYLVKNSVPIGLLIGRAEGDDAFLIELDYVGRAYRDFKMGSFIYRNHEFFQRHGYKRLLAQVTNGKHDTYLGRMGFRKEGGFFVKELGS